MSYATCTKCGLVYHWHASRGSSLKDNPSPCCSAPGKAVGTHKAPPKESCPKCGKAGLWYRKALQDHDLYMLRPPEGTEGSTMYCPRCRKWVKPVKQISAERMSAVIGTGSVPFINKDINPAETIAELITGEGRYD